MADFKPQDCQEPCRYPVVSLPTGSGHARTCPAHQRWEANGRSWRAKQDENPLQHTVEAQGLVEQLCDLTDRMRPNEVDFIEGLNDRFDSFGERTFISDAQINWLRGLAEKYK